MKNKQKPQEKMPSPVSRLTILYSYYCKLNPHKLKHKNFDDVTDKTQAMDLHEFMTFCKDFHLIAKHHKHIKTIQNSQEQPSKIEKQEIKGGGQSDNIEDYEDKMKKLGKKITEQLHTIEDSLLKNEFFEKQPQKGTNVSSQKLKKSDEKMKQMPLKYLSQRKLAELFKKEVLPEGTISFQGFQNVMVKIAVDMYQRSLKDDSSKNEKRKKIKDSKTQSKQYVQQSKKEEKKDFLQQLLGYLNLDTKQHMLQTFKKINELHGNLQHLALMRNPVKKVNPKHDPLGKYAGVENENHSRLVQTLNKPEMIRYRASELPSLKGSQSKTSLKPLQKQIRSLDKQNFQSFLNKNMQKIELLHKNYESRAKVSFVPLAQAYPLDSTVKYQQLWNEKREKKYSQRHKDRIMGNIVNKELGRLIDASELYNDDIFNKYLEINHSPHRLQVKLSQSRFINEK